MFIIQPDAAVFTIAEIGESMNFVRHRKQVYVWRRPHWCTVRVKITHELLSDLKDFIKQTLPEKSVKNTE